MDVKKENNPKAFIFTLPHFFFIAALSEASEKLTLRPLYNGQRMYAASEKLKMSQALFFNFLMVYFLS